MIYATFFTHSSHRKSLCSCIKDTAEKKTEVSVFPGTSETLRWSGSSLEDTDEKKKKKNPEDLRYGMLLQWNVKTE